MTLVSIKSALSILTMFRKQLLTNEERERVELAIEQLSLAQVSPSYLAYLNTPVRFRPEIGGRSE